MTTAILDTNIFVRAAIRSSRTASARVLDAYYAGRFELIFSPSTAEELLNVLTSPEIRARHGWSDDEILRFLTTLLATATIYPGKVSLPASLTRDITDTKFLGLAQESGADYLVSKDNRHLLRLKQHHGTRIVTPARFLRELA